MQIVRIIGMIFGISIRYLSLQHIYFNDSKAGGEISIHIIDRDGCNCFILGYRFGIEGRYINNVAIGFYQVDIRVFVNGYQSLGFLVPGYMSDAGIT